MAPSLLVELSSKSPSSAREDDLPRSGRNDSESGLGNGSVGIVRAVQPIVVFRGGSVGAALLPSLRGVPESSSGCCCCGSAGREEAAPSMIGSPSDPNLPGPRRILRWQTGDCDTSLLHAMNTAISAREINP